MLSKMSPLLYAELCNVNPLELKDLVVFCSNHAFKVTEATFLPKSCKRYRHDRGEREDYRRCVLPSHHYLFLLVKS